jgi:hypothetical protein
VTVIRERPLTRATRNSLWVTTTPFILLAAAAVAVMWWVTAQGIGIDTDSITYVETADALRSGHGFVINSQRVTHYPPMYSLVLAALGVIVPDIWKAARWLHVILFATNVVLIGALGKVCTRSNAGGSLAMVVCFFAPIVYVHSVAWSEPLFITLSTLGILLLLRYMADRGRGNLYGASFGFGFAALTRYVGAAFIPVAAGYVLWSGLRNGERRLRDVAALMVIASLPLTVWALSNIVTAHSATGRELRVHLISPLWIVKNLAGGLHAFWFVIDMPVWLKGLECALIVGLVAAVLARSGLRRPWVNPHLNTWATSLCGLLAVSYLLFVLLSRLLFDAVIPLNTRILSPLLILVTMVLLAAAWSAKRLTSARVPWYAFVLILTGMCAANAVAAFASYSRAHREGIDFASLLWKASPAIRFVKTVPMDQAIYSNGADVIKLHTGRSARSLPERWSPYTEDPNVMFAKELSQLRRDIDEGTAVVVYFNTIDFRPHLARSEDINREARAKVADAAIFAAP